MQMIAPVLIKSTCLNSISNSKKFQSDNECSTEEIYSNHGLKVTIQIKGKCANKSELTFTTTFEQENKQLTIIFNKKEEQIKENNYDRAFDQVLINNIVFIAETFKDAYEQFKQVLIIE